MKISNSLSSSLEPYTATMLGKTDEVAKGTRTAQKPTESASGDTVSVSRDALLLTEARRTAQNTPDVRADKVDALRAQVADGTYVPDSRRIAEALAREEAGLFAL